MADEEGFKIKGAALKHAQTDDEQAEPEPGEISSPHGESTAPSTSEADEAEASIDHKETEADNAQKPSREVQLKRYRWCKCICDPGQFGRDHYFLQMDTQASQWEEPNEPYWLWDATQQKIDDSGLHYPANVSKPTTSSKAADPNYSGYNPKIHGHYDPNADYAQYHEKKREEEAISETAPQAAFAPIPGMDYTASGNFNRFTGNFQGDDKNTERHSDFNKSGRQMGAYFDVDAAANAHEGRSLREERRNEKLSKKQIKELADKRRAKKEKKRLDFYKS